MIFIRQYEHPKLNNPDTVRSDILISSVRVESIYGHDHVHIWNRGGKSGEIIMKEGDGQKFAEFLKLKLVGSSSSSEPWVSRSNIEHLKSGGRT